MRGGGGSGGPANHLSSKVLEGVHDGVCHISYVMSIMCAGTHEKSNTFVAEAVVCNGLQPFKGGTCSPGLVT